MSDLPLVIPQNLSRNDGVICAMSTRLGGVSGETLGMNLSYRVGDRTENVNENRKRFFHALGVDRPRVAFPGQCHSTHITHVTSGGEYADCDGLVTKEREVWLAVSVADCVPLFLFDPIKRAVGAIHAGWRGTAAGIAALAVRSLRETFDSRASDIKGFLGPSAGVCCYQIGEDVANKFDTSVLERRWGSTYLDLRKALEHQLTECGIRESNLESSKQCTICTPELFHSYRRDKDRSGRMLGIIGLTS